MPGQRNGGARHPHDLVRRQLDHDQFVGIAEDVKVAVLVDILRHRFHRLRLGLNALRVTHGEVREPLRGAFGPARVNLVGDVPAVLLGRQDDPDVLRLVLGEEIGDYPHRLVADVASIRHEQHAAAVEGAPVSLLHRLGPMRPGRDNGGREDLGDGVGALLPLDHHHLLLRL